MSGSIKSLRRRGGYTVVEVLVLVTVVGLLITPILGGMFFFYTNAAVSNAQAGLAVESQNILRSVVEELRISSGVRSSNTITDPNAPAGGWNTSNDDLVLIISTPALNSDNDFIFDPLTGDVYQNELVYYALDDTLYKRTLAHPQATGNRVTTSCPADEATASCPADVMLSEHFETMNFVFYDQDNNITTSLSAARSIKLLVNVEQQAYGRTLTFENNIRVTIRNST